MPPADLAGYAPRTEAGRAGVAALLQDPARALVACDYDGTLAPVVDDPGHASAQPGAVDALVRLTAVVGTVAVVTGRPAETAVALAGLDRVPGLVVLGAYGAERWEAGSLVDSEPYVVGPAVEEARAAAEEVVRATGIDGTWLEDKGGAFAVHVRGCPDPEEALEVLSGPLALVAARYGLRTEPGRLVVELRPPGADKGQALLDLAVERRARTVVFVGDDLGDLAAFAAVEEMRGAGLAGLTVASASEEAAQVVAAADLVVPGPPGVVALLERLADAVSASGQA